MVKGNFSKNIHNSHSGNSIWKFRFWKYCLSNETSHANYRGYLYIEAGQSLFY